MSETRQESYEFEGLNDTRSRVIVRVGDILDSTAQILVSSDDDRLTADGGVSLAIATAGGAALRKDMRKIGGAEVGQVVATGAGDLSALYVFHAITRRAGRRRELVDETEARETILSLTRKCLALLKAMGGRSIAFPALGTGFAGYQAPDVAAEMAKGISEELRELDYPPGVTIEIFLLESDLARGIDTFWNEFEAATRYRHHLVRDHVVFLIHGIRTHGNWQEDVRELLEDQDDALRREGKPLFGARIPKYGFFDVFRFLLPFRRFRSGPIRQIERQLMHYAVMPEKEVSVIAHSFGTYIVSEILKHNRELKLKRIIFCGAIVSQPFDWQAVVEAGQAEVYPDPTKTDCVVINDCGARDIWPVLAEAVTVGYGASGRFGFGDSFAENRFHSFGHSGFFTEPGFAKTFWLPALTDGRIKASGQARPTESLWINYLPAFMKLCMIGAIVLLAIWLV